MHLGLLAALVLFLSSCGAAPNGVSPHPKASTESPQRIRMENMIQVQCSLDGDLRLKYTIKNNSAETIHVLDGERMPYASIVDDGVLVLHGVGAMDPDVDYFMVEIPVTKPLGPNEELKYDFALNPLNLSDHFEFEGGTANIHGKTKLTCQVGWLKTPILASERHLFSIETLLSSQQFATGNALEVVFP
jgi:hypothetical protein